MLLAHGTSHAGHGGMRAAVRVEHQLLPIGRWQLKRRLRSAVFA